MSALRIRSIGLIIIAAFAVVTCPVLADAKDRGRGHRVKIHGVKAHAVKHAAKHDKHRYRGGPRVRVSWLGPYGVFPAYAYGAIIDGAFGYDYPPLTARTDHRAFAMGGPEAVARLCQQEAAGSPDDTVARIGSTVEPTEAQRHVLEELRTAMAEAASILRESCAATLPLDPVARFGTMQTQIDSMSRALGVLRPPLQKLEQSLSHEQRARIAAAKGQSDRQSPERHAGGDICEAAASVTRFPLERIARTVRPRAAQREALIHAFEESARAAEVLERSCEDPLPATPLARLDAMERHLRAAGEAIEIVRTAVHEFYVGLSAEQKARFDRMNARQAMRDQTVD